MNSYLDPIRRFPWLPLIAVPISLIAAMLVIYEAQWGGTLGPKLSERNKPTYQASVQILVNSSANPYLRARESPEGKALLDAANYLPFLIQSDRVAAIRKKKLGPLPGVVTAQALFARETNRGLNASPIPIIEVNGVAPTPRGAVRLAQGTVDALIAWLTAEQSRAKVAPGGRILVERLRSPTVTVDQKSSNGLAVLVFVVILLGFISLAWMLDRVFPRAGSTALGADGKAVRYGRDPMVEPAMLLHNAKAVATVDGERAGDHAPESTPIRGMEEPEAPPASQRRWA